HMFWDMSQIDMEALDDATRSTLEHALEDLYVQMDRSLGRIVAELPDADLVLTTPMSMGVNMSRVDFLPGMLEAVLGNRRAETRAERFLWRLRGAVPTEARAKVASILHGPMTRELTMRLSSIGVDWSKTPSFAENGAPQVLDIVPTVCAALGVGSDDLPGSALLAPA